MKLFELKKWIESVSDADLEKDLIIYSENPCITDFVKSIEILEEDLYYLEYDDPNCLFTKSQMLDNGYMEDEIDPVNIELFKGMCVVTF